MQTLSAIGNSVKGAAIFATLLPGIPRLHFAI
jgi:hypothetical protein